MQSHNTRETICAPATAPGQAAISVIRLSGPQAIDIAREIFFARNPAVVISQAESYRLFLGEIREENRVLDEVMLVKFQAPHSYTGEDVVEISCHGSPFIVEQIIRLCMSKGARMARPGEFTMRAFLNGRMDLSQAEAVADLIASNSSVSQQMAFRQMRGHFSQRIQQMRARLLEFAGLIELELDFSEEDVEFADRKRLDDLLGELETELGRLQDSFQLGNVLKSGVPVAIIGKPNVGKSTLLNAILNEERAIVSEIPGTTRDVIEDLMYINGVGFRFIDTAGLRDSDDEIESIGIGRTWEKITQAAVILYLFDVSATRPEEITETLESLRQSIGDVPKQIIPVANKIDLMEEIPHHFRRLLEMETIFISAKRKENIQLITEALMHSVDLAAEEENQSIVTSSRHYEALAETLFALQSVKQGLHAQIPGDLLAIDIRTALHHLGTITGEISSDEILGEIFSKFCIGK